VSDETPFKPGLFKGRSALVTGGGTGIGFAIARELGRLGARVLIAARDQARLEAAAQALRDEDIDATFLPLNMRDEAQVAAVFERLKAEGALPDILANNAGGQFAADPLAITPNGFRAVVDLNLTGTWLVTRAWGERVIAAGRGGKVVSIVLSLESGLPDMVHAGAARAGVINMTKSLAVAWGPRGITVNAIAPGTIDTPALEGYDSAEIADWTQRLPIKRLGRPEEVAQAVAYLASPAGDYITGTTLFLDGGEHLMGAAREA
jgi:NAD(P)-dependent dehydrogenase (short-subunit alcohol dehydrogenase family)